MSISFSFRSWIFLSSNKGHFTSDVSKFRVPGLANPPDMSDEVLLGNDAECWESYGTMRLLGNTDTRTMTHQRGIFPECVNPSLALGNPN